MEILSPFLSFCSSFAARNKPKGSSFSDDNKDFVRFTLGKGELIPAFEEAISTMKVCSCN